VQIVTDSGTNVQLTPEESARLNVHIIPLQVTINGKTYREGIDLDAAHFYPMLEASPDMPLTSQPPVGEFVKLYEELSKGDEEILSIHMSSGLSGTYNAAMTAASMVRGACITVVDTLMLGAPAGWQVEAAAKAAAAGWSKDRILALMARIRSATEVFFTLKELKYLIHGGRISHLKGLIGSLLNIKPLIGVEKEHGTYVQQGQSMSFSGAIKSASELISRRFAPGTKLRMQVVHADNLTDALTLKDEISRRFNGEWLPVSVLSLVLGAHVGASMIGVAAAPEDLFAILP
jgi:DegV family protein with EDD domain